MLNSLSGRFLILTTVFVMLAEVLIFVPSVARYREDYLVDRLERAIAACGHAPALVVAGGVAANASVRAALEKLAERHDMRFVAPPPGLCTDNAAMIAYAGLERFARGERDDMTLAARPRWPLDRSSAGMLGGGRKGPKA